MRSVVLASLVGLAACASPLQFVSESVPIGDRKYQILGEAHGKACTRFVLFIPIGVSSSLHDAYEDALEDVEGADGLISASIDQKWFQVPIPVLLPIYSSFCTEFRGKAIKFVRPAAQPAVEKAEPTPTTPIAAPAPSVVAPKPATKPAPRKP